MRDVIDSDHTSAELASLAQAIAAELKPAGEWRYTDGKYSHSATIIDTSGRRFNLNSARDPGRLSISGDWQRIGGSCYMYADRHVGAHGQAFTERPNITLAKTKTPKQLAGDIARRFLPAFVKLWDLAEATKASTIAYENKRKANALRLANAVGVEPGGEDKTSVQSRNFDEGYFTASASDDTANVDCRSLPMDLAEAIVRLVAGKVAPEVIALINSGEAVKS